MSAATMIPKVHFKTLILSKRSVKQRALRSGSEQACPATQRVSSGHGQDFPQMLSRSHHTLELSEDLL